MSRDYREDLAAATGAWIGPAPPPPARRRAGPVRIDLPPETFDRAGSIAFDYSGTGIVTAGTFAPIIGFTVPQQIEGVVNGIAAGSLTPADNDELEVELFVDGVPRTGDWVLNTGAPLLSVAAISADLTAPSPGFLLLASGNVVSLSVREGTLLSVLSPYQIRPVRGRIVGRFWPKLLAQAEG